MRVRNHYKMACLICKRLAENDMPLRKPLFLFGNLAPDLFFSFLFRPHLRSSSAALLHSLILRLYGSGTAPEGAGFCFQLGVVTHYVCDYFCYPHTSVFEGRMRDHIQYERNQDVTDDMLPFFRQKSLNLSPEALILALDDYFTRHELLLANNASMSFIDVSLAVYAATWVASAIYLNAGGL